MKQIILILLLIFSCSAYSQELSSEISTYATSYQKTGDFSGCILISKADEAIYQECFGMANQDRAIKNKLETQFMIGSISKQFTSAAILLLEEQGLLQTTELLSKFLDTSGQTATITLEHLMTHTSGVPDIYQIPEFKSLSSKSLTLKELSYRLLKLPLEFEPGTQYQYSNGGYALLALVVEQVSGKDFGDFVTEHIAIPLKMNYTGHKRGRELLDKLALGYDPLGYDSVTLTEYVDPELLKGSGSLYSTVNDLDLWVNSIKNKSLLSDSSYDKLLKNYGNNYGFGISVYNSFNREVFGHDGRINGFIADYLHYLEEDLSIIILGNIQTGVADFFRRDIAAIIFGEAYAISAKSDLPAKRSTISPETLVGTYGFGPNFKVYVEIIDGRIQARANEGGYSELIPLQDGRFFSRTLYAYITFVENENTSIHKMIWTNNDGNSFDGLKE